MKKSVSVILAVIVLMLSLSSCDYVIGNYDSYAPDWYIGGYEGMHNGSGQEFYWVESYDEMLEAVELLKSHGSTFAPSLIFTYDGELFDTKYCFHMSERRAERIKWGENPFDRKVENVRVESVAFLEDVSIDWVRKHYISSCDAYELRYNFSLTDNPKIDYANLPREWKVEEMKVNVKVNQAQDEIDYDLCYDKSCIITVDEGKTIEIYDFFEDSAEVMSDECLNALLGSLTVFGIE